MTESLSRPERPHRLGTCLACVCSLLFAATPVSAQLLTWQELPNAPFTSRFNDVYFVDPDRGWIANGDGEIFQTTDGGDSWTRLLGLPSSHFRSIGFISPERGFAGNVGAGEFGATDRNPLYESFDGGLSWRPIGSWHGRTPTGLCGMHVVNDSVVVAVGRVRGPAFFARTTDGGETWRSTDMSSLAAGLIDVYFSHPDSGFAVGLTNSDHESSSGVVLRTTDGGATWQKVFTSTRRGEWCWKISFPSSRVGYVSLQRNSQTPIYILKTTDGGASWQEKLFSESYYFVQGIGFIDEQRGWIGGNSSSPVFETTDGGETWQAESIRRRINRFRFFGDSLGYAVGRTVHKLANWSAVRVDLEARLGLRLDVGYPNPFTEGTSIAFSLGTSGRVDLSVFDMLGRRVAVLVDDFLIAGTHSSNWNGRNAAGEMVPSGSYIIRLRTRQGAVSTVIHRVR